MPNRTGFLRRLAASYASLFAAPVTAIIPAAPAAPVEQEDGNYGLNGNFGTPWLPRSSAEAIISALMPARRPRGRATRNFRLSSSRFPDPANYEQGDASEIIAIALDITADPASADAIDDAVGLDYRIRPGRTSRPWIIAE